MEFPTKVLFLGRRACVVSIVIWAFALQSTSSEEKILCPHWEFDMEFFYAFSPIASELKFLHDSLLSCWTSKRSTRALKSCWKCGPAFSSVQGETATDCCQGSFGRFGKPSPPFLPLSQASFLFKAKAWTMLQLSHHFSLILAIKIRHWRKCDLAIGDISFDCQNQFIIGQNISVVICLKITPALK